MSESSSCSWKCTSNSGCKCFYIGLRKCWADYYIHLSIPTIRSWWRQWEVMAPCCCYPWWRWWWYDTLLVTLIRLWPCLFLSCYLDRCCGILSVISWMCVFRLWYMGWTGTTTPLGSTIGRMSWRKRCYWIFTKRSGQMDWIFSALTIIVKLMRAQCR